MRIPADKASLARLTTLLLLVAVAWGGWRAHAQQAGQKPFVFRSIVGEVLVHATVLNNKRQMVDNLPRADFSIFENGVPQNIDFFSHEDAPVSVGIIVDNSGSMRDKRKEVNQAALNFVKASNPNDEVFIVNFNEEYYLDAPFTNNIPKLQQGLDQIESRGGTALYDAVIASLDYLTQNAKNDKHVLLVVTDGDDNASRYTLEQTIRIVQAENPPLMYCIGLLDALDNKSHVERTLKSLAENTGGEAFFPKSLDQVDSLTRQIAADIRQQYSLAYRSNQTGTGFRAIRVEVRDKKVKNLTVRARTGYFQSDNPHPDVSH